MKDYNLFNKLNKEVELGNVRRSELGDLFLYKYTEDCAFNKNWNEWNRQARGIIFRQDAEIVARPFSKFFNLFEMPETMPDALPSLPYEVQEKVDGCFHYDTPILLGDGITYKRIGEIVNDKLNIEVMGYNHQNTEMKPVKVLNYFNNGKKKNWIEIEINFPYSLKSGGGKEGIYRICVTDNHKFWDGNSYKSIKDFKINDPIWCIPEKYRKDPYFDFYREVSSWDLVKYNIINIKSKEVNDSSAYDIETESHNFFAKGVLVHNSCGSAFIHNGAWRLATPGAFESEQALYGTELLKKYNWDVLPLDVTPIFEIVYPANRIVVDYDGQEFLSLLAIFDHSGKEWHSSRVDQIAHQGRFKRPRYFTVDPLNPSFEENMEGYVIRYENGFRVKIKSPIYSQIHKLLGYLSPKGVIELLQGKEYGITVKQLPPAIAKSFDDIRAIVTGKYYEFTNEVERLFTLVPEGTKKDKALWIQANVPQFLQGQVFAKINGKDISYKMWNIVLENL